jgi:hypothetical protein
MFLLPQHHKASCFICGAEKSRQSGVTPKPCPNDEATIKMLMKHKFLGTQDYTLKTTTVAGQVKSTNKLSAGEWCFFLDQVYDLATKGGVMLTVPMDSDYSKLKRKQVA